MRLTAIAILSALSITSALAADVKNGERLAQQWCATCHLAAASQTTANGDATPFATIATRGDFDETKLAFFLLAPHPRMPDMALTRAEAADLAAYIASQR